MIEIICNEGEKKTDSPPEGQVGTTKQSINIKQPRNIKQIGEITSDKKIYIEDYVFTYINSIAYENPDVTKVGVLLGECQKHANESYTFIKGSVKVNFSEEDDYLHFDEKIWSNIYEDMEKYFYNLEIMGWFVSTPFVSIESMEALTKIHTDNFAGNTKTLYLIDTAEHEESFYLYEGGNLKKQGGFVCFYERNNEMQEYMLANRGEKSIEVGNEDTVVKHFRTLVQEKKQENIHKKNMSLAYTFGTFLAVVIVVIGINIMNSYDKMNKLDDSLNNVLKVISNMNKGDDSPDVTPVNKVNGNVYPTESQTQASTQGTTQSVTQGATQVASQSQASTSRIQETNGTSVNYKTYIVEKGDSLMSIVKKIYGDATKIKDVQAVNGIDNPDKIYVGQELKLP